MNTSVKFFKLFILLFLTVNAGFAQQNVIRCFSEENFNEQAAKDPGMLKKRLQTEAQAEAYSASVTSPMNVNAVPYIIPVVVHVIHEGGDENISNAQVKDQIRILNEDYRRQNKDTVNTPGPFKGLAADFNIEFRLAQLDPNGNCTDGINHVYSRLTNEARDNVKSVIWWDNTKYLNIWVVKSITDGGGGGSGVILGFSSFPGLDPSKDGIVVRSDCFGSIGTVLAANYDKWGRTSTHEVGHYLSLRHIWGDDNGSCSADDGVSDTPLEGDQHYGCGTFPILDNCSANYPGIMFMNYMDYSDGNCVNMFKKGQKAKSDGILSTTRNKLWSPTNLIATGTDGSPAVNCTPNPDFITDGDMVCEGDSVAFKDMTWHGVPTTWAWSFPGGSPSSSGSASPKIKYNTAGNYDVSLTTSNGSGTKSITKTAKIFVSPNSAIVQDTLVYNESYDVTRVPGQDWYVINPDAGSPSWKKSFISGTDSVMRISQQTSNVLYHMDEMISPSINITKMPSPMMKFNVAYVRKAVSTNTDDALKVFLSPDCGQTWTQRYSKTGTILATAAVKAGFFTPSTADWRTETVSLSTVQLKPNVRIKFQFSGGAESNNIYINDFKIYSSTVGLDEITSETAGFVIYPNPSKGNPIVEFNIPQAANVSMLVQDLLGRQIWQSNPQKLGEGTHQMRVNTELKSGMYFVSLLINNKPLIKKLVIE
jgi:hypothetical protein